MTHWLTTRFEIHLTTPRVMGIVNVTPDSFSDGGRDLAASLAHCERLVQEGAHILDVGGESTRPGSRKPTPDEEWARVEPVLRHALTLGVPVSVDTSSAAVMRAALDLGTDIVNDVRALRAPGAIDVLAAHPRAGVCLMHMQGEPATMQDAPAYTDVVAEVAAFLRQRMHALTERGVASERIVLDPGIGFGKTALHNLELLRRQHELLALPAPLLVGWSRKSILGRVIGRKTDAQDRVVASVAAALAAVERGARIVRVHDVQATVDALAVWQAAGLGHTTTTEESSA